MSSRLLGSIVLVAVLALTACTGSDPAATPSATPPRAVPSASSTEAASRPHTTLPLSCADLFSVDELQPLLSTPVDVRQDETTPPRGLEGARLAVAGISACVIGGENRTDGSYDQGLSVEVVPGGAAVFDAMGEDDAQDDPAFAGRVFGDRSTSTCWPEPDASRMECSTSFVVGDYRVRSRISDAAAVTPDEAAALAGGVFDTIARRITAAGAARPLWVPATAEWRPDALCADSAAAGALLGSDRVEEILWTSPQDRVGAEVRRCLWRSASGDDVLISGLADGAWAFTAIAATPGAEISFLPVASSAVDVPGADGALLACGDGCSAVLSIGGSLVQVELPSVYDPADATARLTALAPLLP